MATVELFKSLRERWYKKLRANDWAGLVLTILSILGIYLTGLRWFIRNEVRAIVRDEIKTVKHELSNNGGSSTKDKIDFIYLKLKEQDGNNG